jgi:Ser/Thr protein kinase RdoA (MazF antagonist)
MAEHDSQLDSFRSTILQVFPDLERSSFRLMTRGWDSLVVDVDDRWIFKLPRDAAAERRLLKEASVLAIVASAVSLSVPKMSVHRQPRLFTRHEKLHGEHLVTLVYDGLPEQAKQATAEKLARFFAQLHSLDQNRLLSAGAGPIGEWLTSRAIRARALPRLPADLQTAASDVLDAFEALQPDPYGSTYGYFDGHGWNMAFDVEKAQLNGIFDFADSGFGPVHQEFIYTSFISPDLTERVVAAYESIARRQLDRRRIEILAGVHRLHELAEMGDHPEWGQAVLREVELWARDSSLSQ